MVRQRYRSKRRNTNRRKINKSSRRSNSKRKTRKNTYKKRVTSRNKRRGYSYKKKRGSRRRASKRKSRRMSSKRRLNNKNQYGGVRLWPFGKGTVAPAPVTEEIQQQEIVPSPPNELEALKDLIEKAMTACNEGCPPVAGPDPTKAEVAAAEVVEGEEEEKFNENFSFLIDAINKIEEYIGEGHKVGERKGLLTLSNNGKTGEIINSDGGGQPWPTMKDGDDHSLQCFWISLIQGLNILERDALGVLINKNLEDLKEYAKTPIVVQSVTDHQCEDFPINNIDEPVDADEGQLFAILNTLHKIRSEFNFNVKIKIWRTMDVTTQNMTLNLEPTTIEAKKYKLISKGDPKYYNSPDDAQVQGEVKDIFEAEEELYSFGGVHPAHPGPRRRFIKCSPGVEGKTIWINYSDLEEVVDDYKKEHIIHMFNTVGAIEGQRSGEHFELITQYIEDEDSHKKRLNKHKKALIEVAIAIGKAGKGEDTENTVNWDTIKGVLEGLEEGAFDGDWGQIISRLDKVFTPEVMTILNRYSEGGSGQGKALGRLEKDANEQKGKEFHKRINININAIEGADAAAAAPAAYPNMYGRKGELVELNDSEAAKENKNGVILSILKEYYLNTNNPKFEGDILKEINSARTYDEELGKLLEDIFKLDSGNEGGLKEIIRQGGERLDPGKFSDMVMKVLRINNKIFNRHTGADPLPEEGGDGGRPDTHHQQPHQPRLEDAPRPPENVPDAHGAPTPKA